MSPAERAGNPYTALLADALRRGGLQVEELRLPVPAGTDIVHVHWPEQVLFSRTPARSLGKGAFLALALGTRPRRRPRIVWTGHNDRPHEWGAWSASRRWSYETFLRHVDGVVHLSAAGRDAVEMAFPFLRRRPSVVVDHGDLAGAYPTHQREQARAVLGLEPHQRLVLVFGRLRPYRQVQVVMDRFMELGMPQTRLLISGPCRDADFGRLLVARASTSPQVTVELGLLSADALSLRLSAADLVVQPFDDVLHSGSVHLALGMGRPVLAPALGSLPELRRRTHAQGLLLYDGDLTTDDLRHGLAVGRMPTPPLLGSWSRIAAGHIDLYCRLIGPGCRSSDVQ